jgi:hypothetical protein
MATFLQAAHTQKKKKADKAQVGCSGSHKAKWDVPDLTSSLISQDQKKKKKKKAANKATRMFPPLAFHLFLRAFFESFCNCQVDTPFL